jgi:hypothetical protein
MSRTRVLPSIDRRVSGQLGGLSIIDHQKDEACVHAEQAMMAIPALLAMVAENLSMGAQPLCGRWLQVCSTTSMT